MSSGNKRPGSTILPCICCPSTSSGIPVCVNQVKRQKLINEEEDTCEVSAMETTVESDCDSVGVIISEKESDAEQCDTLMDDFGCQYISIENDPYPYELREGYDCTDPLYPDRRWWLRIENTPIVTEYPYPQAVTSGDRVWWRGEVPFPMVIAAEDYNQDKMMDWYIDEKEHRDDWDAEVESDCARVTSFEESVTDSSDLATIPSDWESDDN